MPPPRKIRAEHVRPTRTETARAAGVSFQAVDQSPYFKKIGRGIDVDATKDALESIEGAQRRKEIALANLRELEEDEKSGLLLNKADVVAEWAEISTKFRDALMALPTRIVNRLPDEWKRQAHNVISDEVRKALKALSDDIRPSTEQAA